MKIGTMELIVIFLVAFLALGPERTMVYVRKLGKGLRTVKVYMDSLTEDLKETVVEPLQEIEKPLKDLAEPLSDLTRAVQQPVQELNQSLDQLNHPGQSKASAHETKAEPMILEMAQPLEEAEEPAVSADADVEEAGVANLQSQQESFVPDAPALAADIRT